MSRIFPTLIAAAWLASGLSTALAQDRPTLTIYTYESFTAEWGPGPLVEKAFEAQCSCDLKFVAVADGVALLNRVRLEGAPGRADIVLGLDTSLTADAKATGLFAPSGVSAEASAIPGGWSDDIFTPFDYGYFAVVYDSDRLKNPPKSLKDLVEGDPDQKIAIQDPRTSTPGLGLVLWVRAVYGDQAPAAWEKLRRRVLTATPGWSESYGLFTKGEAPMVLSYTTSPAYHLVAEGTGRYKAAAFAEGHYLQVEVAGLTRRGAANPLARQFLTFMSGPGFQDAIPETNWMFPAGRMDKPLDPAFDTLVKPVRTLAFSAQDVARNRKAWVEEWLAAMGG